MDPITSLAATAVVALAPYLAETSKEFDKQTGKAATSKIGALYQALKTRFKNKPAAKEALADLEANPGNEDAQAALRRQLTKQMNADPTLTDTLRKLLDEIKQDKDSFSFLTQVYGGEVGEIINANYINEININKPSSRLSGDSTTDARPSRLPGTSTTDAPPPEGETKEKKN